MKKILMGAICMIISMQILASTEKVVIEVVNTSAINLKKNITELELDVNYPLLGMSDVCGIEIRGSRSIQRLLNHLKIYSIYNIHNPGSLTTTMLNDKTAKFQFSGYNAYLETLILKSRNGSSFRDLVFQTMGKNQVVMIFASPCTL